LLLDEFNGIAREDGVMREEDGLMRLPANEDNDSRDVALYDEILFFACGLGSSICYIATLSSLVFFMMQYGPNSYVYLNLAVYLPLLPISTAQARYDQHFDRVFRSNRTFFFRGAVGFVGSVIGTILIPTISGPGMLVVSAVVQGTAGAILLGTFNQMASFMSSSGRLKATISAGSQASALVVLAVSLSTGFGSSGSNRQMGVFFLTIAVLECMFFGIFLLLMYCRPPVTASMIRRDSSIFSLMPLLNDDTPVVQPRDLDYFELWESTRTCCVTLIVTLIPTFLVASWFTHVRTSWMQLPQLLFYTRIGADFCGRIATILVPPCSVKCLAITSGLRFIPVVLFFINASGSSYFQANDLLSIVLVALIAFLSGYLVTGSFQLAPELLTIENRQANVAKQASLLNVAFSFAAVGGLLSSFSLIGLGL
jgi:MFS family permease